VGLPFNHADVIALPLLLGMGVDSSIHLVRRHRAEADPQGHLVRTSTGRAVAFSGLTTLASFGSLSLAPHLGIATLGRMLSLGVLMMLLCTLVVLPAFLSPHPGRSD
jgi:predicted RND superfamily exporter protein